MKKIANLIVQLALAGAIVAPLWGVPVAACLIAAGVLTAVSGVIAWFL